MNIFIMQLNESNTSIQTQCGISKAPSHDIDNVG